MHQQLEFLIQLGILDLLAILVQALQALFDHHQVAEDEFGLDVLQIAQRIHRAFLVRDGLVFEQAQHVGEGVPHAQAGQVAGIAQALPGDRRHVHVFDRGVRDLGRLEEAAERFQARVGNFGDAGARGGGTDARFWWTPVRMVNREVLPTMGKPIMAVFIWEWSTGELPPG